MGRHLPSIILTSDVRAAKLSEIAARGCVSVRKPVEAAALSKLFQRLVADSEAATEATVAAELAKRAAGAIFVVDDDRETREAMAGHADSRRLPGEDLRQRPGIHEIPWERGQGLPRHRCPHARHERIRNAGHAYRLRQEHARDRRHRTGRHPMAVQAMRTGAVVHRKAGQPGDAACRSRSRFSAGGESDGAITERSARRAEMAMRLASLTKREHEVMDPVVAGTANKAIVARLCISQRTVETTAPHS
jgi:two-component system, chemotaxis family, CheB/CheR fusion protein